MNDNELIQIANETIGLGNSKACLHIRKKLLDAGISHKDMRRFWGAVWDMRKEILRMRREVKRVAPIGGCGLSEIFGQTVTNELDAK